MNSYLTIFCHRAKPDNAGPLCSAVYVINRLLVKVLDRFTVQLAEGKCRIAIYQRSMFAEECPIGIQELVVTFSAIRWVPPELELQLIVARRHAA
ncbi:hypothetical protein MRX96_025505 [Rhipicephalus microplus]